MTVTTQSCLYVCRFVLNPRSREVQSHLARPYEMHRTLMTLFPAESERADDFRRRNGVLYRVEQDPKTDAPSVLLQSAQEPAFESLVSRAGYLLAVPAEPKVIACVEEVLVRGRTFRFRLRANVSRKVETKSGPDGQRRNGRRVAVRGEEEQRAWLERKGAQQGFELLAVRAVPDVKQVVVTNERDQAGRGKGVLFSSVLFEGRLRVTDTEALSDAVRQGIGPEKAFGCGLLSLAAGGV